MSGKMRKTWVLPVLEDVRNFLRETEHTDFADDLDALIARHRHGLAGPQDTPDDSGDARGTGNVVDLRGARKNGTTT